MSRIGKVPIEIPAGVTVSITDQTIVATGPKGELTTIVLPEFSIVQKEQRLEVAPIAQDSMSLKLWGMQRTLVANSLEGVSKGFTKILEVNGVGFRVTLQGKKLVLNLGFSHPIEYTAPDDIDIKVEQTTITISGADKQKVGAVAASIREFKKPEPYKGKGIKYQGEVIRRKAGKTAAKTAG
jgi:large subunit ribosomal protein L6